jgi:hypothetical protein
MNVTSPMFQGVFGNANDVLMNFTVGNLSATDIANANGTLGGSNVNGPTVAYWAPGQFAPGAGALVIVSDVDVFTNNGGGVANYNPLNDNGIFALNTSAYLAAAANGAEVPEPASVLLWTLGAAGVVIARRRKMRK